MHGVTVVVMVVMMLLSSKGRLFEGNADTMLQSINAIKALDERTLIFPGEHYCSFKVIVTFMCIVIILRS